MWLGGTEVNLLGVFNQPEGSSIAPEVYINSIFCSVTQFSNVSITCLTGYRSPDAIRVNSISVTFASLGNALIDDNCIFKYMDKWSHINSWKGFELPVAGDLVWIPQGQNIVLDVNTSQLLFLLVQGDVTD